MKRLAISSSMEFVHVKKAGRIIFFGYMRGSKIIGINLNFVSPRTIRFGMRFVS